jgi:hypothetical protein
LICWDERWQLRDRAGWHRRGRGDLWFDDFAVDEQRVGCD